jgi:hypothetical protein
MQSGRRGLWRSLMVAVDAPPSARFVRYSEILSSEIAPSRMEPKNGPRYMRIWRDLIFRFFRLADSHCGVAPEKR